MPKIVATIFLVSICLGLFLPLSSYAKDVYSVKVCSFTDTNGNKEYDSGDTWTTNPPTCESKNVQYSGFVLCGKCVGEVEEDGSGGWKTALSPTIRGGSSPLLTANAKQRSQDRCGAAQDQIYIDCQLCHIFTTINKVVGYILGTIVPPLAVLMLVIGGAMFYLGGARPDMITRGRKLMVSVAIGLALIYGAYMIVGFLLTVVGAANIEAIGSVFKNGLFSIDCPIVIPTLK